MSSRKQLLQLLDTANVKLASIASTVFGVSGMPMLGVLARRRHVAPGVGPIAKGALCKKMVALTLALEGHVRNHHRFVLDLQLHQLDLLKSLLTELDQRIDEKLHPAQPSHQRRMPWCGID